MDSAKAVKGKDKMFGQKLFAALHRNDNHLWSKSRMFFSTGVFRCLSGAKMLSLEYYPPKAQQFIFDHPVEMLQEKKDETKKKRELEK